MYTMVMAGCVERYIRVFYSLSGNSQSLTRMMCDNFKNLFLFDFCDLLDIIQLLVWSALGLAILAYTPVNV